MSIIKTDLSTVLYSLFKHNKNFEKFYLFDHFSTHFWKKSHFSRVLFLKHKIPYWDIQGRDLRVTLVKNSWTFLYVSNGYQTFINRKSHVWSTFGYSLALFAKSGNSLKTLDSSRVSTKSANLAPKGAWLGWRPTDQILGSLLFKKSWHFFFVSNGHQTLIIRKRHVWSTFRHFLEVYRNDWAFIQDTRLNEVGKVRKIRDRKRMVSDEANFTGFG